MSKRKLSRRALVRTLSFSAAALVGLSLFSAVCWGHLQAYRRQTAVDADRAFEETVGALNDLSASLEKSRYAGDGPMCAKVCAEIYADAGRAGTALSALPFSTVEMEELKRFISLSGDYAYTLCREAAEQGLSEEQRNNLVALSGTAAELAGSLRGMHGELRDGILTMDSREKQVANILGEAPAFLSARLGDYARSFPATQELSYHGQYSAQEKQQAEPVDEAQAREQAAAEEALRALGYEGLRWEESARRGNVLELRGSAETDGVTGLDHEIAVGVALDDGSICALDLSAAGGEAETGEWPFPEEEAKATVPEALHLRHVRRVTIAGADGQSVACYELDCLDDGGKRVRVYVNAQSGKQQEIMIG